MTAKQLYEYIWNLNILYMNHPNIDTNNFWWNKENGYLINAENNKDKINIKKCYPFVLRYFEILEKAENYNSKVIHCPLCSWYTFCPGCIINPKDDLEKLTSNIGIVVDWCFSFIQEEFQTFNFRLYKEIDDKIIIDNLPPNEKKNNIQDIKGCLKLYFKEQIFEDPLYCQICRKPEKFYKQYSLKKLPNILIISLERFQFIQNDYLKLRRMITYPLYDFEIENKKYDLYGVVNHIGSLSSGHYNAIIKNKNEWILCDDDKVNSIKENEVINKNTYILFYISKDFNPNNKNYSIIISFLNNLNNSNK